jgi:hypothetical protein
MLKLQSFVSELGTRLKGGAWLLATGQQKLDDLADSTNLGKLKARFPPSLRVHLAPANIRDVVHKRLLSKEPKAEIAPLTKARRPSTRAPPSANATRRT